MTETELTDRLREAIVLDGPDVWRTNGYLQDAQQAGMSLTDALKRANEVSQEVANNSLLFDNIQARIARLALPSRSHFIDQDLNQIINAASSLNLSPDFVKNRWVPVVLQRLAAKPLPPPAEAPGSGPVPAELVPEPDAPPADEEVTAAPEAPKPAVPAPELRPFEPLVPPVAPKVVDPAPSHSEPSRTLTDPPPVVRSFTATPASVHKGQPVTLAWEVDNILAVTIDDLGEGLSPKNRGWVKPSKTTDYTLFDANNNPLSTVRVNVIPRDRSGIYGVLFALVLLAIIYWFIKSSNSTSDATRPSRKTEQKTRSAREENVSGVATVSQPGQEQPIPSSETTEPPATAPESPAVATTDNPKKDDGVVEKSVNPSPTSAEPEPAPTTPADARQGKYEEAFGDKPFDKVELGTDELGWRRARSKGRWGYINEADEWVIQPEFEAVTPFRGNTASAFLNGQLITINRNGEQVRN